jgi:hypothetical protein
MRFLDRSLEGEHGPVAREEGRKVSKQALEWGIKGTDTCKRGK